MRRMYINMIAFILGFSTVFISLGGFASTVSYFLQDYNYIISKVVGVLIIILGIHYSGLLRIRWLDYEKRFHTKATKLTFIGAFLVGLAFSIGWSPCVGPILAAILGMATQQGSTGKAMLLLATYSAGLGIPFFISGVAFSRFITLSSTVKKHFKTVEVIGGLLLILVGIFLITNAIPYLAGVFNEWFPWLNAEAAVGGLSETQFSVIGLMSFVAAFLGGLLSFLSPCVLPVVPGYLSFISGLSIEELKGQISPSGTAKV